MLVDVGFPFGAMAHSGIIQRGQLHDPPNLLRVTELYDLQITA